MRLHRRRNQGFARRRLCGRGAVPTGSDGRCDVAGGRSTRSAADGRCGRVTKARRVKWGFNEFEMSVAMTSGSAPVWCGAVAGSRAARAASGRSSLLRFPFPFPFLFLDATHAASLSSAHISPPPSARQTPARLRAFMAQLDPHPSRPPTVPITAPSPSTSTPAAPASPTHHAPTSEEIDAVIQMATSSRPSADGRPVPLKDTRTQLFAGNLPYRVRWQDLKDLFRKAGTVLRADVSLGPDNRSRGYGTVLLATAEDAGRAVDMFNGYSWQSRILEVRLDRLPADLDNPPGPPGGFLAPVPRPLPYSNPMSPAPTSAFAAPAPHASFDDPYAEYGALYGHDRPSTAGAVSRNLFVGNLPFHCQWQDLKDLFRQAGTILRADVALGPDGRSRGFGTVVFATELDSERAAKMFNG
ncbi:RNA-binding domain-containing protein [Auriscalpium vulgare]|uniref:RNA-binding domain-containing protein n=1 Tax=Auriscalpium vulgare TaxID=40419 RepID=A0ACB8RF52_9AGAM|nr:RNA-binding domain-containing protein [Auriscalpium vulgare]